ncbi:hypothetical protein TELCIR_04273 [Teladorsagia circumcincta]|uniref:Uncharacterized protein n=1 Tax=Teladorsagia circumcincta TaxID=45464 RepID=A0A2G9UU29_TELCI|nr:hypothetical protein TELCIR_04273 [Teladorsagia circumcincta]
MTAVGAVGPGSTMTAVGAPAGGPGSTMTAVGAPAGEYYLVNSDPTVKGTSRRSWGVLYAVVFPVFVISSVVIPVLKYNRNSHMVEAHESQPLCGEQ